MVCPLHLSMDHSCSGAHNLGYPITMADLVNIPCRAPQMERQTSHLLFHHFPPSIPSSAAWLPVYPVCQLLSTIWWLWTSGPETGLASLSCFWPKGKGYPIPSLPAPAPSPVQGGLCPRGGPCLIRQQHWDEDHVPMGGSAQRDGRISPRCWWGP